jgi:hypothetical protein
VVLALLTTPPNYLWQQFLERTFPAYERPGGHDVEKDPHALEVGVSSAEAGKFKRKLNIQNTLSKWFVDCITLGALVNTAMFLFLMGVMKGQTLAQVIRSIQTVSPWSLISRFQTTQYQNSYL